MTFFILWLSLKVFQAFAYIFVFLAMVMLVALWYSFVFFLRACWWAIKGFVALGLYLLERRRERRLIAA